jgi:dienelactone hydrolase
MPAPRLAELWDTVQKQTGKFQKIAGTRHDTVQGYRRAIVTCVFGEDTRVDVRWALDANGRVAGLSLAPATSAVPWVPPAYTTPTTFEERDVTVGSGKWQLPGTLTLPKGKGPFAAVVLVHGSGPQDRDETIGGNKVFKDLAWGLASRNIAVLRYEKRTKVHGAEMVAQPSGITVNEETVDDAVLAVGQLAAMPEIDRKHIYVLGHSLGAMMAPRIAEHAQKNAKADPVAGLILMAGTTRPLEDVVVEQVRYLAELDGKVTDEEKKQIADAEEFAREVRSPDLKPDATLRMLGIPIPGSYFLDLRNYHPAEAAAKLKLPMLILQGERDYQVRMADFEGWKKALGGKRNVTLKSYPGLNHLFITGTGPSTPREYSQAGHVAEEVIKEIADWIHAQGAKR